MSVRVADAAKPYARWGLGHVLPRAMMAMTARKGDLQGRMFLAASTDDPFPAFERVRAEGPLYRGRFAYVTTSLPVVRETLSSPDFSTRRDPAAFSGPLGRMLRWSMDGEPIGPLAPPSLLVTEPPDHTRYRKLVTRVFSVRAVEQLRVRTETIAAQLLDDLAARHSLASGDSVDLVDEYCALLPVTVIAEILGVPLAERGRVLAFGAAAAPSLDLGLPLSTFRRVEASLRDFERWLTAHIEHLRRSPGDDLLSQLVTATDDGVGLDDRELKSVAGLVLAAGFETTVNLLGNGVALLAEHPDQLAALRDEPALWPNAVEETLRFDPPVLLTGRVAERDTTLAGTAIGKGSLVTTVLAAANRDPDVFSQPDVFDITRDNAKEHVSFSAGRHYCLGAALARMEGEVGLRMLHDRYPGLTLLPGRRRRSTRILRGYDRLPARLT